ncbi:MAG: hypothetical protein AB7F86_12970 [Bdellovibrionales bacterium]
MLKSLFITVALLGISVSTATRAQEVPSTLKNHMYQMGYLMDEIWVKATDPTKHVEAAEKVSELRGHLTKAIGLMPPKVQAMTNKVDQRLAMIEYHQLLSRVIYLSASLENTLLRPNLEPTSQSKEKDIQNLLKEISVIVGRGHAKFR